MALFVRLMLINKAIIKRAIGENMERLSMVFLKKWIDSEGRKPIVLRGARQVGKTWLVRKLATESGKKLIELNFEKNPRLVTLFSSNEPNEIVERLSVSLNVSIDPKKSLLFLDEIQAAPELFAKLRWFAEDLAELPVIAAGSLLEFVLNEHSFSVPVGRINYMHLEPLSFEEFLLARDKVQMHDFLSKYVLGREIPEDIHQQYLSLFKEYLFVGGMPAAVVQWIKSRSLTKISQIHQDLIATYRDDFAKYSGRLPKDRLEDVLLATPRLLGQKFVFSQVNSEAHPDSTKRAVGLLNQARVCHSVVSCAANGIPLASETKKKFFKEIFIDTGLCCSSLGMSFDKFTDVEDIILINNGAIAEQVVGQMLRTIQPYYMEPTLFYWHREEKTSKAELDYVIQHENKVIPIEVKAGASGKLKSLHLFMKLKSFDVGVRICSASASVEERDYTLLTIPFYLCGQIHRLLDQVKDGEWRSS